MKKSCYTGMLFCLMGAVSVDLFCADDIQQEETKHTESSGSLRTSKKDIFELLQSTSSSDKEDERDTYAERDVSSGGSETELTHSFQRSMTPPFTSRNMRIERGGQDDVDSCVLEQVARFSITSSAVHSAFAHVLEEQRRQRHRFGRLEVRIRALEKAVNHIADNACHATYCREHNEAFVTEGIQKAESNIGIEMYHMRKRMGSLEDSLRHLEDDVQNVIGIVEARPLHPDDSLSLSIDSQQSNRSKREPTKGRLMASSSSGSDLDISPLCLIAKEIPNDNIHQKYTESGQPDSAIVPLDLNAQQLT